MTTVTAVSRLRQCSLLLVWLWVWIAPMEGWAQQSGLAIVEMVTELDETGRYREIDVSTRATLSRGGETIPIRWGLSVLEGDTLTVGRARVRLRYTTGERVLLVDGARIVVTGPRSVLQELGEVYYRLKDVFQVGYGSVETVVEGTRFVVLGTTQSGTPPVRVRVDQGRVTVRNGDASVAVRRGQEVVFPQSGGGEVVPTRASVSPSVASRAFAKARPRALLQVIGAAEILVPYGEGTPSIETVRGSGAVRVAGGVGLGRTLRLLAATTVSTNGSARVRLPQELSVGIAIPGLPLVLGGGPELTWEQCIKQCGGRYKAVHLGGTGWAQLNLPIGPRFGLVADARFAVADVARASGGMGLEVAF